MAEEQLVFTLEGGDVVIKLRPDLAPKHVEQITKLARDGFYDGLTFHRVIDGFVAQGGCPNRRCAKTSSNLNEKVCAGQAATPTRWGRSSTHAPRRISNTTLHRTSSPRSR